MIFSDNLKENIEKFCFYLSLLVVFFFPIYKETIPPLLVLWFLLWLIRGNFRYKGGRFFSVVMLTLVVFYLIHLAGMINTSNYTDGLFDLEVKLSLIFFPLVFITTDKYFKLNFNKILGAFVLGNTIASIVCVGVAVFRSLYFDNGLISFNPFAERIYEGIMITENNFFYERFSVLIHTSYFSMYLAFSIIILSYFIDKGIFFKIPFLKNVYYLLILFFLVVVYLLSSKAGILVIIVILSIATFMYILRKRSWINVFLFFTTIIFIVIAIKFNTRLNIGTNQIKSTVLNADKTGISSQNDRLVIWFESLDIIRNNLIFGVGTGDYIDELIVLYKKNNIEKAYKHHYNAHNQFIDTIIGHGLIGLVPLVFLFIYPLIFAIKRKNYLFAFFLLVVNINFIFESMLNRQAGVTFYTFFISLLSFAMPDNIADDER
ncbi:MAG: O-antigen ligase family protein [Bacteroidia bacterium]|nr:O-antigen ligase family protein [Bacteroidia bacterium]